MSAPKGQKKCVALLPKKDIKSVTFNAFYYFISKSYMRVQIIIF